MRRSIRAAFEDEVATPRHLVQAQETGRGRQLERDAAYEMRETLWNEEQAKLDHLGIQFCIQRRLTSSPYTSEAQV
jgi:hypothetical protein